MMLLNGAQLASERLARLKDESKTAHPRPHLAIIRVGEDPASRIYVRRKLKAATSLGFQATEHVLPAQTTQEALHDYIKRLSHRRDVHAILLQLPLPPHLSPDAAIEHIDPDKDADGLHPIHLGRLMTSSPSIIPCTPKGILSLLQHYTIPLKSKHVTILGRSRIVGLPLSALLLQHDATVTLCHRGTPNPFTYIQNADIVVTATGSLNLFPPSLLKEGSTLIDVGIIRTEEGIRGDILHTALPSHMHGYTPVPFGVGPMTVASLMENVWQLYTDQTV